MRFLLKGCQFFARQSDCMRYERDISMQKGKKLENETENINFHLKRHNRFYHKSFMSTNLKSIEHV